VGHNGGKLICPGCGEEHDPQLLFCTRCGARLPLPTTPPKESAHPSGRSRGIEPEPDALFEEPSFDGGRGASAGGASETAEPVPPVYAGSARFSPRLAARKIAPKRVANPTTIGVLVVLAILFPPLGILTAIIWAIVPQYRRAALPVLAAAILGGGLWVWFGWSELKRHAYDEPYAVLMQYVEAQDWAYEATGRYYPLLELKTRGFMPAGFPPETKVEFSIVEHVLGPTGYLVEFRPETEEVRLYGMQSLWVDNTGDVRIGSRDGPRFSPTD